MRVKIVSRTVCCAKQLGLVVYLGGGEAIVLLYDLCSCRLNLLLLLRLILRAASASLLRRPLALAFRSRVSLPIRLYVKQGRPVTSCRAFRTCGCRAFRTCGLVAG